LFSSLFLGYGFPECDSSEKQKLLINKKSENKKSENKKSENKKSENKKSENKKSDSVSYNYEFHVNDSTSELVRTKGNKNFKVIIGSSLV
jgi:hypothetical protein